MGIEDKYEQVMELIALGKEKGYLLYDEVKELMPADISNSEEAEDILATFGTAGIEVIEESPQLPSEEKMNAKLDDAGEDAELDLSRGSLDKTNDPVRMYLREMRTVPLLTRVEEVEIAKRIERGQNNVLKAISRSPIIVGLPPSNSCHFHHSANTLRGSRTGPRRNSGAYKAGASFVRAVAKNECACGSMSYAKNEGKSWKKRGTDAVENNDRESGKAPDKPERGSHGA